MGVGRAQRGGLLVWFHIWIVVENYQQCVQTLWMTSYMAQAIFFDKPNLNSVPRTGTNHTSQSYSEDKAVLKIILQP
jgi:hypothetical protein